MATDQVQTNRNIGEILATLTVEQLKVLVTFLDEAIYPHQVVSEWIEYHIPDAAEKMGWLQPGGTIPLERTALDKKYQRWYRSLQAKCWELAGCDIEDLPDREWSELFEEGCSPREAITCAMHEAG